MGDSTAVNPDHLEAFAARFYSALGVPDHDATIIANSLVQADLWGHQSHGVMRLSWYAARIKSGVMSAAGGYCAVLPPVSWNRSLRLTGA